MKASYTILNQEELTKIIINKKYDIINNWPYCVAGIMKQIDDMLERYADLNVGEKNLILLLKRPIETGFSIERVFITVNVTSIE